MTNIRNTKVSFWRDSFTYPK